MAQLLSGMATARSVWTSEVVRAWYSEEQLHQQLVGALHAEAGRAGDADAGRHLRDTVALPGIPDPLEWANRLLSLPDGGWAVTRIHFRYDDPAYAFVDVVATTAPPTPDGLAHLAEAVLPSYEAFAPLCLRVEAPAAPHLLADLATDHRFSSGGTVAHHVVAGRVEDLRRHPRASSYPLVHLRRTGPAEAADRAATIFTDLEQAQPRISAWARAQDSAGLAEASRQQLLFEVLVNGHRAGVVAAVRDDDHGMTGVTIKELCLDDQHRGRRLAAAVLQRLVDELPAQANDVLWGTIHPDNQPSLRNALSTGRTITSSVLWITPTDHPGMPPTAPSDSDNQAPTHADN